MIINDNPVFITFKWHLSLGCIGFSYKKKDNKKINNGANG